MIAFCACAGNLLFEFVWFRTSGVGRVWCRVADTHRLARMHDQQLGIDVQVRVRFGI